MKRSDKVKLVGMIRDKFPSFGGGKYNPNNIISVAAKDDPAMFAAGVDILEVVNFILAQNKKLEKADKSS